MTTFDTLNNHLREVAGSDPRKWRSPTTLTEWLESKHYKFKLPSVVPRYSPSILVYVIMCHVMGYKYQANTTVDTEN